MAPVPGTIKFSFIAVTVGCHRICYRINNSGGYTCVTVNCTGLGNPCSVNIPITVDNETCNSIEFDGYAQACCEPIESTNGRVPFSVTFTPTPACGRYIATCTNVPVLSVSINTAGSGYTVGSHPTVSFSGGGGSGAAGTANVGTGFILTSSITNGGTGYTDGTYANVSLQGGTGTGALGTVTISGGVVTILQVTNPGNGYHSGDTLHPDTGVVGVPVVQAIFTVTTDYGKVISVTLTAPGSGYTSAPAVTIAPSATSQATATANLATCPAFTIATCSGTGSPVGDGFLSVGQTVAICSPSQPTIPSNYSLSPSGNCLCSCNSYTIAATGAGGTVQYKANTCDGNVVSGTLSPTSSPSSITGCYVTGSVIISNAGGQDAQFVYAETITTGVTCVQPVEAVTVQQTPGYPSICTVCPTYPDIGLFV